MKNNKGLKILLGGLIASFVFAFAFAISITTHAEETTDEVGMIQSALDWLKSLSAGEIKGWLYAFWGYVCANGLLILFLTIKLIMLAVAKYKESETHNKVTEKQNAEQQKREEEIMNKFDEKLNAFLEIVKTMIKDQDERRKEEAKSNIAVLQSELENIKVDLDK